MLQLLSVPFLISLCWSQTSPAPIPGTPHGGTPPLAKSENLGIAGNYLMIAGNLLAFVVGEEAQGDTDLNGDDDTEDYVLHLRDLAAGTTISLGVAAVPIDLGEGRLIYSAGGILAWYDIASGTSGSTGLAASSDRILRSGSRVAFHVYEGAQGRDFNGDGDRRDSVLHLLDLDSGAVTNLGFAVPYFDSFVFEGSLLLFRRSEADDSLDLNSDGDLSDSVLHVHDLASGATTNLGLDCLEIDLDGDLSAFVVSEGRQGGTDLEGDGDSVDAVLHVYDHASGAVRNLGSAVSLYSPTLEVHGNWVVWIAVERDQGTDLNGDGDLFDGVIQTHDRRSAITTNLGLAGSFAPGPESFPAQGDAFAFVASEGQQYPRDLNGDGDRIDAVVHVHDLATGTTVNTRLAVDSTVAYRLQEGRVVLAVSERSQGYSDLDGDGDFADQVLVVFDPASGQTRNLGMALYHEESKWYYGAPMILGDGDVVGFVVDEGRQGGRELHTPPGLHGTSIGTSRKGWPGDLNGDGDGSDVVLYGYSLSRGTLAANVGTLAHFEYYYPPYLDDFSGEIVASGNRFVYQAWERQLNEDLNHDGDREDLVPQVAQLRFGSVR